MSPLTDYILQKMDDKNINQLELSRLSGVPNTTLDRLLGDLVAEPKPSVLLKISKTLGVSFRRLMVLAGYPVDEPDTIDSQNRRLLELAEALPWLTETIEDLAFLEPDEREAVLAYIETLQRRRASASRPVEK